MVKNGESLDEVRITALKTKHRGRVLEKVSESLLDECLYQSKITKTWYK